MMRIMRPLGRQGFGCEGYRNMVRSRPLILAFGVFLASALPAAAFTAANGMAVASDGARSFVVAPARGKSSTTDYWCAAGDFAIRRLGLRPSTRLYRMTPGSGRNGIRFSLDAQGSQRFEDDEVGGISGLQHAQRQPVNNNLILADEDFLGFPIGPDSFIAALKAELHSLDSWRLATALIYLQKGTINQYTTYQTGDDAYALVSPTTGDLGQTDKNAVEHRLIWSVDGL